MTTLHIGPTPPTPTKVFDTYLRFAAERQEIYYRRLEGSLLLTSDPILQAHRFTNVYRASDRVSQYLIRHVIYDPIEREPEDMLARILLFKVFNKISTWERLVAAVYTGRYDLANVLDEIKAAGETLYSAAYVMPSPQNAPVKHRAHLAILEGLTWEQFSGVKSLQGLYEVLLAIPSFGPFLAYQYAIDLNYSPLFDFSENEFVVPGPGALDGIRKCFSDLGSYDETTIIRWVRETSQQAFLNRGLSFRQLPGRWPTLIDWQNVFCEISKYARVAHPEVTGTSGRTKIKQSYKPAPEAMPEPFFPPKWRIS